MIYHFLLKPGSPKIFYDCRSASERQNSLKRLGIPSRIFVVEDPDGYDEDCDEACESIEFDENNLEVVDLLTRTMLTGESLFAEIIRRIKLDPEQREWLRVELLNGFNTAHKIGFLFGRHAEQNGGVTSPLI